MALESSTTRMFLAICSSCFHQYNPILPDLFSAISRFFIPYLFLGTAGQEFFYPERVNDVFEHQFRFTVGGIDYQIGETVSVVVDAVETQVTLAVVFIADRGVAYDLLQIAAFALTYTPRAYF